MKIAILTSLSHAFVAWDMHNYLKQAGHNVSIIVPYNYIDYASFDLVISYYWPHIISQSEIVKPKYGMINCHPSLLPFNRGVYTNVYPLV